MENYSYTWFPIPQSMTAKILGLELDALDQSDCRIAKSPIS